MWTFGVPVAVLGVLGSVYSVGTFADHMNGDEQAILMPVSMTSAAVGGFMTWWGLTTYYESVGNAESRLPGIRF